MNKRDQVKVAIIDNSIDSELYNPVSHWKSYLEVDYIPFKAKKSQFPNLKDGYTHLLLTGSEASIMERENWVYEEVEVVQQAVEQSLSILGSCYGHQLLALALAGPSSVRRCEFPEIGWIAVDIIKESTLLGKKRQAYSFSVHFDEVKDPGESFVILSSTELCPVQAFQIKEKPIWGIQIHPEIDILRAKELLRHLLFVSPRHRDFYQKALDSAPKDSELIYRIIQTFIKRRK